MLAGAAWQLRCSPPAWELSENILQNLRNKWPPHLVDSDAYAFPIHKRFCRAIALPSCYCSIVGPLLGAFLPVDFRWVALLYPCLAFCKPHRQRRHAIAFPSVTSRFIKDPLTRSFAFTSYKSSLLTSARIEPLRGPAVPRGFTLPAANPTFPASAKG